MFVAELDLQCWTIEHIFNLIKSFYYSFNLYQVLDSPRARKYHPSLDIHTIFLGAVDHWARSLFSANTPKATEMIKRQKDLS